MIEHINANKLITTKEFVREPVDIICREIDNNPSRTIILSGGRGTGKSTILYNSENKGIGNDKQLICTRFDASIAFQVKNDEVFTEEFLNHYYELTLSRKLLYYIKEHYGFTYEKYFKDLEELTNKILYETNYYIHNAYYIKISLSKYLVPTELSSKILERLKNCLNISSLSLAIDRFDWTNGNSALSQNILSNFFDIFDKTIITTDDDMLQDKDNRGSLIEKGYSFIDINYGQDIEIAKEILRRRILQHNQTIKPTEKTFPDNIITDDIYQSIFTKTNGNISIMIEIIRQIISLWEWEYPQSEIIKRIDSIIDNPIEKAKTLKKMSKQPQLYL